MNLLSVNNLSKSFGDKVLFEKISFGINYGEKVALVAQNGSGKSTLFKILKGLEIPDEGEVVFRKEIRVGFLDQNILFNEAQTIEQLVANATNQISACIRSYEEILAESEKSNSSQTAAKLEKALSEMNRLEAWDYEKNIKEILSKLGLIHFTQQVSTLSGGQKKRLALALMLIDKPDLLILDEPTNHLDIDMIEWLENYLQQESLSILLVTHDRYFLDEVCERIVELDNRKLYEYKGNFDYYLEKKEAHLAAEDAEIARARNLYRRELVWVRKMPKARGTKSKARVDAFYEIEKKAKQKRIQKRAELSLKMERMGSKISELHKITKQFKNTSIISEPFTYTFIPGEKVGLVGKNGVGKTTFLNIIQGKEQTDSGKVIIGETVVFGYYSQQGMVLNNDKRIIEVVRDIAEYIPLANGSQLSASQLLTRFNFPPAIQYNYAHTLSGGEKRRLYLLTVLMKNPNFLILDEPTNDLDIITLQTLEEFLEEFKGCVLIVSHDRYFIDRLVDHLFVMEGDGKIKDFPGNYTEYRQWKSEQAEKTIQERVAKQKKENEKNSNSTGNKKLSYKLQRELEQLEKEIPELEKAKSILEESLSNAGNDYEKLQQFSNEIMLVNQQLEEKNMRWIELMEQIQ